MNNYYKGLWAEMIAAGYLILHGYRIRSWRYKTAVGEIDLVVSRGRTLVFVEVKARPTLDQGTGAIRPGSHARLMRAGDHYLNRLGPRQSGYFENIRFDLIAVAPPFHIRHLDNVLMSGS
jgi:putative endonuclease